MGSLKDQLLAKGLASKPAPAPAPAPSAVATIEPARAQRLRDEEAAAAGHASNSRRYPGARIVTLAEGRELFVPRAYDLRNLSVHEPCATIDA